MYNSRSIQRFVVTATILSMVVTPGCSRKFWREQAEKDVYNAITEKQSDQRWLLPRMNINPDERSRFFDPFDPDCKPLPPDDPAAHKFMHCANGIKGFHSWHGFGDMISMENPQWLTPFGVTLGENGQIDPVSAHSSVELRSITLQEAIELSYIHSRDYQTQIEDLYLTALDLTFQRYQFGVRYLNANGGEPGSSLTSNHQAGLDTFNLNNGWGISQALPAGGQWAVELMNNTLWLFGTGATTPTSASSLAFSFVQPLLFGAGRHVALEGLTQAERNVLYQTRDLARFRKEFFTQVASAYIGILQAQQSVINQRNNIQRLQDQIDIARFRDDRPNPSISAPLRRIPADFMIPDSLSGRLEYDDADGFLRWRAPTISDAEAGELLAISDDVEYQRAAGILLEFGGAGGQTASLQTLQLLTTLSQSEGTLRAAERTVQDQLDNFKLLLGLPPDIQLDVDTSILSPFELIDTSLTDLESRVKKSIVILNRDRALDGPQTFENVSEFVDELQELSDEFAQSALRGVEDEFGPVDELLSGDGSSGRKFANETERERVERDVKGDRVLLKVAQSEFEETALDLETLQTILDGSSSEGAFDKLDLDGDGAIQITELEDLFGPSLREALDRDEDGEASNQDLMNARGEVMDARRQVEIAANALEATLDVVGQGTINNPPGGRALDFRADQVQLDLGIQFTTPLDQIDERNQYAETLVNYQRARRAYMAFEDQVKQEIRVSWRQLRVSEQQLEISRSQLRQSGQQYDSTALRVSAGTGGSTSFDLLNSLSSLLGSQNSLINQWVQYEISRLNIFRDMGIMDVDAAGVWVDDFYQQGQNSPSDPGFILDDPSYDPRAPDPVIDLESPSDDATFPLDDDTDIEPFLPEQAPLPPSASRRVRSVDGPRTADRRRSSNPGGSGVAGRRLRDVLRAGFRRLR